MADTPIPAVGTPPPAGAGAPASATVEPFYKNWLHDDGSVDPKAYERLPEHLQHLRPTLERQKGIEDILTVFANQQLLNGKKGLAPLPANATDAVKAERKALLDSVMGVPSDIKGYGLAKPKDMADANWNQPFADEVATILQKHSVPPSAAQELVGAQTKLIQSQLQQQQQAETAFFDGHQKAIAAQLKLENVPMDQAQAMAERGAKMLGIDLENPEQAILLKNSSVFLACYKHAVATGEDKFVAGDASATGGGANEQALDIIHNPANPLHEIYWKGTGAAHKAAVAKVDELMRLGTKKAGAR